MQNLTENNDNLSILNAAKICYLKSYEIIFYIIMELSLFLNNIKDIKSILIQKYFIF